MFGGVDGIELGRWLVGAGGRRVCRCSGSRYQSSSSVVGGPEFVVFKGQWL